MIVLKVSQPDVLMEPNDHVSAVIVASLSSPEAPESQVTRTDLDSHANMFVGGKGVMVLGTTGRTANVQAFSPDLSPVEIPIVDLAFLYECPYSGRQYIMIARNALYASSMHHNLVPPFLLREAGLIVSEIPKIQVNDPDESHHSIFFPSCGLRIPLSLWGVFSYFPTRRPTLKEVECDDMTVVLVTPPGAWNPNTDVFARNEENMLDWEGKIIPKANRQRILLGDIDEDEAMIAALQISTEESITIDANFEFKYAFGLDTGATAHIAQDDLHLCNINPALVSSCFATALAERAHLGEYIGSVGATCGLEGSVLFPDIPSETSYHEELNLDDYMMSSTEATSTKGVSAEHLSKIWRIDLESAKRTINNTSQRCVRPESGHLSRNFSTNDRMLRYRRLHDHFFMDTFFATSKAGASSRGNKCVQLFVTDKGFIYVVPMTRRSDVPKAIKAFAKEIGAPDAIICDAAREQISHEVRSFCNQIGTSLRVLEENTPWANRAERYIGLIKEATRKDMQECDCPLAFWDYCVERRAAIHNLTPNGLFQLEGRNPYFSVTGQEGDISNLCQFKFYDWVYYREQKADYPLPKEILGRVLGPAKGEGNEMCQWVVNHHGNVIPRRTVRPLTNDEWIRESEVRKRSIFDNLIRVRWGTTISPPLPTTNKDFDVYEDDDEDALHIPEFDDPVDARGRALDQQPLYDRLINIELMLPKDGEYKQAKVVGRTMTSDGKVSGTYDENHILNTMLYDVQFHDGDVQEYAANVIAENILNQVDNDGFTTLKLKGIVDHRKSDDAVSTSSMYTTTHNGTKRMRKTTVGWQLLIRWDDGSEQWVPLSVVKECNPVEAAEYAKARGIDGEPAFAWWVPYTLRKRNVIVAAVSARSRRMTHKYGVELPRNVQHAHEIDKANGNDFWGRALKKEMLNIGVAFEVLQERQVAPVGWTKVTGHLIFDVKMSLERKARWVLDGHLTETPDTISTYAGVVSRESIRIALTYAALNKLDVWASDIRNAYIQAPSSRKDYIICGPEFGLENVGKVALIRRAVYGGKTAGRDYRNHLRECMDHIGFKSCRADPDVWMREAMKADGSEYWEFVLLYCDDTLAISDRGEHVIRNEIGRYFELKEESIGPPDIYLGGKLRKVQLANGVHAWAFGSSQYVQAAVQNVETYLRDRHLQLPPKALSPLPTGYRPEIDVTLALNTKDAAHYQSLIGILRWIVELGRIDICCEVSLMSSHLALPREGHLLRVYHIFAYLKKHHNAEMVFDPTDPVIDHSLFERRDWTTSEMSQFLTEVLPKNLPRPRGMGFTMRAFVDADHATDSMTRKSRTGFIVYLNGAPIYWLSKKQSSIETSSFGSEFTAMKSCTEYIRGLRYKLRMMGIPCDDPAYIYGDNKSVLYNTSIPESTLKKKSQSLSYHFVREGAARDEWRTAYVNTHDNPADLLTKPLPSGEKRHGFVRMMLHHLFPTDTVD